MAANYDCDVCGQACLAWTLYVSGSLAGIQLWHERAALPFVRNEASGGAGAHEDVVEAEDAVEALLAGEAHAVRVAVRAAGLHAEAATLGGTWRTETH